MSDDSQTANPAAPGAAVDPASAPAMSLVGQYIKDLSFENPGAPATIIAGGANPAFNVSISVGVKKQSDDTYAVELNLNAKASRAEQVLFNVELVYGGIFRIKNIPDNQLSLMLMVECPRLIFPFARQVLASTTQQGGFPPLMMEPVDFFAIYRQNLAKLAAQKDGQAAAAPTAGTAPTDKPN
jgi:preprotein translocase subunit SecB